MRGTRAIFASIALAAMTGQTMAGGMLCIPQTSTGYSRDGDVWKAGQFDVAPFFIQELDETDEIAGICFRMLRAEGATIEVPANEVYGLSFSCFARHEVDQTPTLAEVSRCMVVSTLGKITDITCDGFRLSSLSATPGGEFMETPSPLAKSDAVDNAGPIVMTLGNCSEWVK